MNSKSLLIILTVFLPMSAFDLNADGLEHRQEIPLHQNYNNRSFTQLPIECCYFSLTNSLISIAFEKLGDVSLIVTNNSTGSVWFDTFDTTLASQAMLHLSGESGVYEITYITENGDIYEGVLTINQ